MPAKFDYIKSLNTVSNMEKQTVSALEIIKGQNYFGAILKLCVMEVTG